MISKKSKGDKRRLVVVTDNFLPRYDGVARFLAEMLPGLVNRYEVTVVAPNFGKVKTDGYRLVQIPLRKGHFGDMSFGRLRWRAIRKVVVQADIVFTQTIGPIGALGIIIAKRLSKPLVTFIHSLEAELIPMAMAPTPLRALAYPAMRWYTKFLYRKPDLLLTPSEHVDDQLSWQRIKTAKRVVRLGVDTKRFSPGTAKTLRRSLGIAENEFLIGTVGRLAREKDVKTLVRAFIRLRRKGLPVRLLVVADGLPDIRRFLDREGIIASGAQEDVVPYLRAMDVFVLSSLTETTCLSALEAMSCGLAVVSTPVGFVRDYITDGRNGFFFPFRDAYALTRRLEDIMRKPQLLDRLGVEARKLVLEKFTWEHTLSEVLSALEQVSGDTPSSP